MGTPLMPVDPPPTFVQAVDQLRGAFSRVRAEVVLEELPPPKRVAPFAMAIGARLDRDDEEIAAGRLVLLVDPAGQPAWDGDARFVCYARAEVDAEMAADPVLPDVTWSWLLEALDAYGTARHSLGGTVTTTASRRYGALAADGDGGSEVELRCSWSPVLDAGTGDAADSLLAFCDLLGALAGLPPQAPGVATLLTPRRARS